MRVPFQRAVKHELIAKLKRRLDQLQEGRLYLIGLLGSGEDVVKRYERQVRRVVKVANQLRQAEQLDLPIVAVMLGDPRKNH